MRYLIIIPQRVDQADGRRGKGGNSEQGVPGRAGGSEWWHDPGGATHRRSKEPFSWNDAGSAD